MRLLDYFFTYINLLESRRKCCAPNILPFLDLHVTNRCNLRCHMCDIWKTSQRDKELTQEEIFEIITECKQLKTLIISIGGGEALIREDIYEIIKKINEEGILSHLCSNGTLISESVAKRLSAAGLSIISISLDNFEAKKHNFIRGVECFDKVIEGIKNLRTYAPDTNIIIYYLITKYNFQDMIETAEFVRQLGIRSMRFIPIHTNLQHKDKDINSYGGLLFDLKDIPDLRREISKLIYYLKRSRMQSNSIEFLRKIPTFYYKLLNQDLMEQHCFAGFVICVVDPAGNVFPCFDYQSNLNINKFKLKEIWTSAQFGELRTKVIKCKNICHDIGREELNIRLNIGYLTRNPVSALKEIKFYLGSSKYEKI